MFVWCVSWYAVWVCFYVTHFIRQQWLGSCDLWVMRLTRQHWHHRVPQGYLL